MKAISRLALVFAIALAAFSCSKNSDIIVSRLSTIVTANAGNLVTDRGEILIVRSGAEGKDLTSGRFFVTCDVLTDRGGNQFDVDVLKIYNVLTKDICRTDEALEAEALVQDPIDIENIWISGGYINMETLIFYIQDSDTKHLLNLVLDQTASNADTLFFDVRHNAYGETPDNPSYKARVFIGGVSYASFPLSSLPAPITKKTVVSFRYPWYTDYTTYAKKDFDVTGTYDPEDK